MLIYQEWMIHVSGNESEVHTHQTALVPLTSSHAASDAGHRLILIVLVVLLPRLHHMPSPPPYRSLLSLSFPISSSSPIPQLSHHSVLPLDPYLPSCLSLHPLYLHQSLLQRHLSEGSHAGDSLSPLDSAVAHLMKKHPENVLGRLCDIAAVQDEGHVAAVNSVLLHVLALPST